MHVKGARPGRFDKIISVPLPDAGARSEIFKIHCAGKRIDSSVDYTELAGKSDNLSGADISEIVQMSLEMRLKEEIKTGNKDLKPIGTDELLEGISEYMKGLELRAEKNMPKENTLMYM